MKASLQRLHALTAAIACVGFLSPVTSKAQASKDCAGIAADVTAAVIKEPGKVLMIIEDALVINESCVCEIIGAAIAASKADEQLVTQVVQTAISIVPKQSAVIMDCAKLASSGLMAGEITATASGKEAKNVNLDSPEPEPETDLDSPEPSAPLRGIYFMQPPPGGGFTPGDDTERVEECECVSPTQLVPFYP